MFGSAIDSIENEKFETGTYNNTELYLVNTKPYFFKYKGTLFPTLVCVMDLDIDKNIVIVDKGAVPHVANGADIMSPGIISAEPKIKENEYVIVKEETHHKPLSIGYALVNGSSMVGDSGKVIKTVHYVGDYIWNFEI